MFDYINDVISTLFEFKLNKKLYAYVEFLFRTRVIKFRGPMGQKPRKRSRRLIWAK